MQLPARRMTRPILIGILFVILALLVAACAPETTDEGDTDATATTTQGDIAATTTQGDIAATTTQGDVAATPVTELTIQLSNTTLSSTYYPFYVAVEQGYAADEGLELSFATGPGSANAVQQLLAENVDIALGIPAPVIFAEAQGFDLTFIMAHAYDAQFNVLVPEDSEVEEFSELKGLAIGIPELSGGEVVIVRSAIAAQGWGDVDVRMTVVGEGPSMLRAIEEGAVAAVVSNLPNELQLEQELGYDLRRITPDAVKWPGDGLFVRTESLEDPQFRDALVRLIRATIKARIWVDAHPDDSYEVVKAEYAKEQLGDPGDDSYGRPYFDTVVELTTPFDGLESYGYFPEGRIEDLANFLFEIGDLETEIDASTLATDDLVAEAWESIDVDAVQKDERHF